MPSICPKISLILWFLFLISGQSTEAMEAINPESISDQKLTQLQMAIEQAKLLPTPEGVAGPGSELGRAVAVEGTRAVVGATGAAVTGAAYVYEFDGVSWQQMAVLRPSMGEEPMQFGYAVSLSGNRVLVGAPDDGENGPRSGSVFVYDFDGVSWFQTAKINASDASANDQFGQAVSLFGNRILIGAYNDDDNGSNSGSAYIFEFDGINWNETEKLLADDGNDFDQFGRAVSLADDRALIGAYNAGNNGIHTGAAYVFDYDGSTWTQSSRMVASDAASGDHFGWSVSLSGDRVLIGASRNDDNGGDSGSAYVFEYDGMVWLETAKLTASDAAAQDQYGFSVSLDGTRAVLGSWYDDDNGNSSGSAYIYNFDGSNWVEATKINPNDGAPNQLFGAAVDSSGDMLFVGAFLDSELGNFSGSVYVFNGAGNDWEQTQKLTALGASDLFFGNAVSLSGNRALIGAVYDGVNAAGAGSAFVFVYDANGWQLASILTPSDGVSGDEFGKSVSLSGDRALIGASRDDDNGTRSGSAYVFEFDGGAWSETAKLVPSDGSSGDFFAYAVSLWGDRALIGARYNDDGPHSGSAYVFDFDGSQWLETTKLTVEPAASLFGTSVSLYADRALIGASNDDVNANDSGSAFVFDFDGLNWTQTSKLFASDGSFRDHFGWSVSLEGDRALIGAYEDDRVGGIDSGSAYVFDFDGFNWTQTSKLTASDGNQDDHFGWSVGLSGDRAVIGAYAQNASDFDSGAAYVFELDGSSWVETQKIMAQDGARDDQFGRAVSVVGDLVLIGAHADNDRGSNSGSAYVYDLDGTHLVAVNVSGLTGSGLVLQNNGGDDLAIDANGLSVFATEWVDGSTYEVTVSEAPSNPNQACVVSNPTGQIMGADVVLEVVCTTYYNLGVTVAGLDTNNSIELTAGGQSLLFNDNGSATFSQQWLDGTDYAVLLTANPTAPNQTCVVSGGNGGSDDGSGTIDGADAQVFVDCVTNQYAVHITVSGLLGSGLSFTNGGDVLGFASDGTATISLLDDGSAFAVMMTAQPQAPNQQCAFDGAPSGVLNGADHVVTVTCVTTQYSVGGTIAGLAAGNQVVLQNNAVDDLVLSANGAFVFATPLDDQSAFEVTVLSQPTSPNQVCVVNSGIGQLSGAPEDSIEVDCETNAYTIGGVVTGLANNNSFTLSINGGSETLLITDNNSFVFNQPLPDGSAYAVTVSSDPVSPNQTCGVVNGKGTLSGADVDDVTVNCVIDQYYIGGYLQGLIPGNFMRIQNNGADQLVLLGDGPFVFPTPLDDHQSYEVIIQSQPADPIQPCTIINDTGILDGDDVDDMAIHCELGDDLIYRHGFDNLEGIGSVGGAYSD